MGATVLVVLALLVWLLLGFLGLGTGAQHAAATSAPPKPLATIGQTMFTVDGTALQRSSTVRLREGQVLRFPRGTEDVRLNRLECAHDVHRIALRDDGSWRVPDLPSGAYLLSAVILRNDFSYLVHVRSHAAPCPGA
jgi:hypothetical protein